MSGLDAKSPVGQRTAWCPSEVPLWHHHKHGLCWWHAAVSAGYMLSSWLPLWSEDLDVRYFLELKSTKTEIAVIVSQKTTFLSCAGSPLERIRYAAKNPSLVWQHFKLWAWTVSYIWPNSTFRHTNLTATYCWLLWSEPGGFLWRVESQQVY